MKRLLPILMYVMFSHLIDWGPFDLLVTVYAQATTVSGQVKDPFGVPYAGAILTANLANADGTTFTAPATVTQASNTVCQAAGLGPAPCQQPIVTNAGPFTLDSGGNIPFGGISLSDVTLVSPAGKVWVFTIKTTGVSPPLGTGPQIFSVTLSISGASQTITTQLSGAAPVLSFVTALSQVLGTQTGVAFSNSITLNVPANTFETFFVGTDVNTQGIILTGNTTINCPVQAVGVKPGQLIQISLIQDATGGRVVTWNACFVRPFNFAGGAAAVPNDQVVGTFELLANGNWLNIDVGPTGSSITGLVANFLTKAASATSVTNSLCDEGVTSANTLTCANTQGIAGKYLKGTGTTAAFSDYPQGPTSASDTNCATANSICEQAPTAVTSYLVTKPGVAPAFASFKQTDTCPSASCTESFHPAPIVFILTSDQVISSTSLTAITGFSYTNPANVALTAKIDCDFQYNQQTAAVADAFGVQDVTVAPTGLNGEGFVQTAVTTWVDSVLNNLTTTTATNIVTFTPSAITTIWHAQIHVKVRHPSNASSSVLQLMALTGAAADTLTLKANSACTVIFQ